MRILLLLISLALPAAAYLDPVTGNLIVQAVLAGVAALAVAYSNLKTRIQAMFGKKSEESAKEESQEKETPKPENEETSESADEEVKSS